jgi:hypothetical protein
LRNVWPSIVENEEGGEEDWENEEAALSEIAQEIRERDIAGDDCHLSGVGRFRTTAIALQIADNGRGLGRCRLASSRLQSVAARVRQSPGPWRRR